MCAFTSLHHGEAIPGVSSMVNSIIHIMIFINIQSDKEPHRIKGMSEVGGDTLCVGSRGLPPGNSEHQPLNFLHPGGFERTNLCPFSIN